MKLSLTHISTFGHRTLGSRLNLALRVLEQSRRDAANVTGTNVSFVGAVIRDEKVPGGLFLKALQSEFDVSLDWLVNGAGMLFSSWPYLDRERVGRLSWNVWMADRGEYPWRDLREEVRRSIEEGRRRVADRQNALYVALNASGRASRT